MNGITVEKHNEKTILWDSKNNDTLSNMEVLVGNLALVIAIYEKCWFKATQGEIYDYLGNCLSLKERQSNEIFATIISLQEFSMIKNNLFVMLYPASKLADGIIQGLSDQQLVLFCRTQENALLKSYEQMIETIETRHKHILNRQLDESRRQIHRGTLFTIK